MRNTGVFVTKEELERVQIAYKTSGMFLNTGASIGNPEFEVQLLVDKYKPPEGAGLNISTGEFVTA